MKRLLLIFAVVLVTSCSFDNKTGIWKDGTDINQDYQSPKTITNNNLNTMNDGSPDGKGNKMVMM